MKRAVLAVLLIIRAVFFVHGQDASSIDLILLLDTSKGMSSSYENVNNYLTGSFLSEFLRVGDTFHLIAFSENQRLDIARRVNGIGDVEAIIGRMLLQYPLEKGNNVEQVLSYAERYIITLPPRPKKIILITAGGEYSEDTVAMYREWLRSRDTTLDVIQITAGQPLANLPRSGRSAAVRTAQAAPAPQPVQSIPAPAQTQPVQSTPAPTQTQPAQSTPAPTQTQPEQSTPSPVQTQPAQSTPAPTQTQPEQSTPAPTQTQPAQTAPITAAEIPPETQPAQSTSQSAQTETAITPAPSQTSSPAAETRSSQAASSQTTAARGQGNQGESWFSSVPFIIALIILALLILGLIIFFASRKLGKSPSKAISDAAVKPAAAQKPKTADVSKDALKYKPAQNRRTTPYDNIADKNKPVKINPDGPLLLNLFVEDQNTAIGKRNIHSLKSGYKLTVGGGKSDDFYIFLVPMPSHIGEIKRNGSELVFTPQKPKYFPELGSNEVKDCVNKTIQIISDKNYEMRFRFEMYEDPLIALNRMLNSLNVPG